MNAILFEFGLACDAGRKRRGNPNQDTAALLLPEPGASWHPPLITVADGLGGHTGGARASRLVTQVFQREFRASQHPTDYLKLLVCCTKKAHNAVKTAADDSEFSRMSTTIVAAILETDRVYLVNVGDSRAYLIRGRNMLQVSLDHSWVAEQVRIGILSPEQARRHPKRSHLTMAINAARPEVHPYAAQMELEPDDIILLCSDGLWGVVPESLIRSAVAELSPQVAVVRLVEMANRSHGPDNISVIVARHKIGG